MLNQRPYVISIAGFDPSGGAGILSDAKTFEQLDVQGMGVCTAITIQTEDRFEKVHWITADVIIEQLKILMDRYPVKFIKTGIIENLEVMLQVLRFLRQHFPQVKVIWDPVIRASAGHVFHTVEDSKPFLECCAHVYLVTPNAEEAKLWIQEEDAIAAARKMHSVTSVFLKSVHLGNEHGDVLMLNGNMYEYKTEWLNGYSKHGSGCVLSAAITSLLASGHDLEISCRKGQDYAHQYLKSASGLLGLHHSPETLVKNA